MMAVGLFRRLAALWQEEGGGGAKRAVQVELDLVRQLDDRLGMMSIFKERVFEGLRAIDEQAAVETVLFLRHPVAAGVLADKSDCRCRAARRRLDEFHVCIPQLVTSKASSRSAGPFPLPVQAANVRMGTDGRRLPDSCP
jgi:hypothetical protein